VSEVDITDGLKYGFRIMGYYLAVAVIGSVMSAVGGGLALFEILKVVLSVASAVAPAGVAGAAQMGGTQPNVGLLIVGVLVLIIGVLLVLAGLFGSLYKLIADAVAEGQRMSELDDDGSVVDTTGSEENEITDGDADSDDDADSDGNTTDGDPDDGDGDTTDEEAADAESQP